MMNIPHNVRSSMGLVLTALLLGLSHASAEITRLPDVRKLSFEEASEQQPLLLEAQVLRAHPRAPNFFVFAEGEGIFVNQVAAGLESVRPKAGDWIEIRGVSSPGFFSPAIIADEVKILRHSPLPNPRPFKMSDLHSPISDCDWIAVKGRLTGIEEAPKKLDLILLTLEVYDSISIGVQIPYSAEAAKELKTLLNEEIQIKAVIGSIFNGMRQLTGRVLLVNSIDDVLLLDKTQNISDLRLVSINELMAVDMDHRERIRTQGVVTYASKHELFLRGEQASLKVAVQWGQQYQVGQKVEVNGYVWPQPISPAFRARSIQLIDEPVASPEPATFVLEKLFGQGLARDILDSKFNYELVKMKAELVDVAKSFGMSSDSPEQWHLLCRSKNTLFEVHLPIGMEVGEELKAGAELELTGICNLIENKKLFSRLYLEGLWLQIRSPEDIVVLKPAPWFTPQRLLWVLGVTLAAALLLLIWILALRQTVGTQTRIIGEKIAQETVLNERQRIAGELHDNLEQGLTGTAIQLQGSRKFFKNTAAKHLGRIDELLGKHGEGVGVELKAQLESFKRDAERSQKELKVVQDMLSHCGEESRTSILDLRGGLLERMDLPAALNEALQPLADECNATLDIQIEGSPRRLKLRAERNLMLIAKEAASNAARHGNPETIVVALRYGSATVTLSVGDDGCGFNGNQLPPAGHFGLQGMHERINRLGGSINIESEVGKGACIVVKLSTTDWELESA